MLVWEHLRNKDRHVEANVIRVTQIEHPYAQFKPTFLNRSIIKHYKDPPIPSGWLIVLEIDISVCGVYGTGSPGGKSRCLLTGAALPRLGTAGESLTLLPRDLQKGAQWIILLGAGEIMPHETEYLQG